MPRWLVSEKGVITAARVLLALVVGTILAMPWWASLGMDDGVRAAFAPYCHQRFDRSLVIAGEVLPVCARCTGLWIGALAAALVLPLVRSPRVVPRLGVLAWSAAPMAVDLALEHVLGLAPSAVSRTLTGVCFGAAVASFVIPALVRSMEEIQSRCETRTSTSRA